MLHRRLAELDKEGRPIRVGLVGCGRMGQGVVHQIGQAAGVKIGAVADVDQQRALAAAAECGEPVATDRQQEAERALQAGRVIATGDSRMLTSVCPGTA